MYIRMYLSWPQLKIVKRTLQQTISVESINNIKLQILIYSDSRYSYTLRYEG